MKFKHPSLIIPLVCSAVALSLHGYLGYFSRYLADDYCTAIYAHRLGVLRAAWFWYLNWSGRFSASILDAVVASMNPRAIAVVVPFTIVIWLMILIVFFWTLLRPLRNRLLASLALACTSLFTLFVLAPDIRQSLYWGQGMRSVVPPLMMGTIQVLLFDRLRSRKWSGLQLGLWIVLSFIWSFLAGGFSETYAVFQLAALLLSLLIVLILKGFRFSNTLMFLVSGFLGAMTALIIIILAPGNAERQSFLPAPPGLAGIFAISIKSYLLYLVHLVDSPAKLFAIVGLFGLAAMVGAQYPQKINSRPVLVIPALIFGLMYICFPPAAYGLSDAPPARTLMIPTYFFLIGLVVTGAVCGNVLADKQSLLISKFVPSLVIVSVALAASIHAIHLYQSKPEFVEYATHWDQVEAQIIQSQENGEKQVLIPVIQNWAHLNTPNDNPKFWVNVCMSAYYGIDILATPDAVPLP
jgi:hypothetical protein